MGVQTAVSTMGDALAGMPFDTSFLDIVPKGMPAAKVAKVSTVTIDAATNDTLYQIRVNGIDSEYLSDGTASAAEIEAGLVAAVIANPLAAAIVTAAAGAGATLTLTGVTAGADFTVTVSGATLSVATTTAAVSNDVVGFGYGCVRSDATSVRHPVSSDAATAFRGVALHTQDHDESMKVNSTDPDGYYAGGSVSVVRRGRIYVPVTTAITEGTSGVHLIVVGSNAGKFRGTADSTNTVDLGGTFTGLRWHTSSANDMAVLELNLP
jgi:hypothetical protein